MRHLLLGFAVVVFCAAAVWVATVVWGRESDYLSKIQELSKQDTPQGNPKLRKYLKSLTKNQTLTALRQLGKVVEAKTPVEMWPQTELAVVILMQCYPEPPLISDEEFAKLSDSAKRNYQAGSVPGPLSDEAFDKLVAGIADKKEGSFFRYALARYVASDEDVSPQLSKTQKERLFDTCLAVVSDRESPTVVRNKCCDAAKEVLRKEWRHIIYADEVVRERLRTGTPKRSRNVFSLIDSGEIKLTAKTIEQLVPWRQRIQDFKKKMVALQNDEREPKSLREQAKKYTTWLERSPLMNAK